MYVHGLGSTGLDVSRLGLGTAEIGFAYGLGSPTLPDEQDAITLLKTAVDVGVTFFDTANYYGLSEERIRKSGILKSPDVVACTKCAQFLEKGEYFEPAELEKKIREQVENSLRALDVDALPILLLHGPSAEQMEEGVVTGIVAKLVQEGKVRHWGTSVRGEAAARASIDAGAEVVQVAFSIADQRMASEVFPHALARGAGMVNRSVFLKGVFAHKDSHLPDVLAPLKACAKQARELARGLGMPLTELALRYTLSEPAIAVSLVGTASSAHLTSAAEVIARGPLPEDTVRELRSLALTDPDQIDPARWPK